ncbi:8282_t:CDS:2, partial [Acaulospora morrowiae]
MKFFTGDETGLIKEILIPRKSQQKETSPPITKTWGKIDRNNGVQLIHQADILGEKNQIIVARKNGVIEILDPKQDGKVRKNFTEKLMGGDAKNETRFVGLFAYDNTLVTCVDKGIVRYQNIAEDDSSSINKTITITPDLCRLRVHPKENHIFACGGKECELSVWDVNACNETVTVAKNKKETGL